MNRSLLDTDIFSEIMKAKDTRVLAKASRYFAEFGCATLSVLTVFEVVSGLQRMEWSEAIERQLNELQHHHVLELDAKSAYLGGQIFGELFRSGEQIGTTDSMIAATALHHNLTLVTGNLKHFERIQTLGFPLKLENWRVA